MYAKAMTLILVAAALAMGAAGCGDDGDQGTARAEDSAEPPALPPLRTSRLDKATFIKHANANCARLRGNRTRGFYFYVEDGLRRDKEAKAEVMVKAIQAISIPTLEAQTEQLRDFGAPPGDERQLQEILAAYERATDIGAELKSIEEKAGLEQSFAQAGRLAKGYGLEKCAIGGVDNPF